MKDRTDQIVEEKRITSQLCPSCGIDRPTFNDRQGHAYFIRHTAYGRGGWCPQSNQPVKADVPACA